MAKSFLQNILTVSILRWIPVKGKGYVLKVIFKAISKLSTNIFTMRDTDPYALLASLFHLLASLWPTCLVRCPTVTLNTICLQLIALFLQSFSFSPPFVCTAFLCLQSHFVLLIIGTQGLWTFWLFWIYYTWPVSSWNWVLIPSSLTCFFTFPPFFTTLLLSLFSRLLQK